MHCPSCGHRFRFIKSLGIVNLFKVKCPACSIELTTGLFGVALLLASVLSGLMVVAVMIYMEENGYWDMPESIAWGVAGVFMASAGLTWLGWRYIRLSVRKRR